jgi:hypothetical protein
MHYLGIDVHKRDSQIAVLDEAGEIVAEQRIDNDQFDNLAEAYAGSKAALEATGNYYSIYDTLDEHLAAALSLTYDSMRSLLLLESEQGTGKRGKPKHFQCHKHGPMNGHIPRMRRNVLRARIDAYPVHSLPSGITRLTNHGVHRHGCPRSLLPSSDLGRRHGQS